MTRNFVHTDINMSLPSRLRISWYADDALDKHFPHVICLYVRWTLWNGSPTRAPPCFITQPAATFVDYVYANHTQSFRRLGTTLTEILHVWCRNLPTIRGAIFCHLNVGHPWPRACILLYIPTFNIKKNTVLCPHSVFMLRLKSAFQRRQRSNIQVNQNWMREEIRSITNSGNAS
jgi:hypothetical protein